LGRVPTLSPKKNVSGAELGAIWENKTKTRKGSLLTQRREKPRNISKT